ncbi:hypothetical protein ACQEU8_04000 [Streptomyces sp. CA-250714]|uniref:hypothetical protein n=1 Tax=Streptomyces sp. CA-250714 TaxID=3240060 RepID=UPI003D89CCCE
MAVCESSTGNPLLDVAKGFFDFLGDPVGTIIKGIANSILAGAIAAFGTVTNEIPTFAPKLSRGVNEQVQWLVVYVAMGSLLVASIKMAVERKAEPGTTAMRGLVRLIVVAGGSTAIVGAVAAVGDDYANYLFVGAVDKQLDEIGCSSATGVEPFLLLVLALLLLIAALVHTILLYVRLAVMILLFGTLPLAAAASMSDWGGGWWRKHIGWMIAWLLYKPTAGLVIYAGSDLLTGAGGGGEGEEGELNAHAKIAGICVMLLSAIALPALLKLVVPATAGLGGEKAYSAGVSAVGGALASGAKVVSSTSNNGSASGAGGSGGPRGPAGASADSASGGGQSGSPGRPLPTGAAQGGGGTGSQGGSGGQGAGAAGGSGASGGSGAAAGAAKGAGAAAGPVGAAIEAAVKAGKAIGGVVKGGVDDADGSRGHNQ